MRVIASSQSLCTRIVFTVAATFASFSFSVDRRYYHCWIRASAIALRIASVAPLPAIGVNTVMLILGMGKYVAVVIFVA